MKKNAFQIIVFLSALIILLLSACSLGEGSSYQLSDLDNHLTSEVIQETVPIENSITPKTTKEYQSIPTPTPVSEGVFSAVPHLETILARQPLPETVVDGNQVTFTINPDYTLQTIRTTAGGNFINIYTHSFDPIESVSLYNLNNLDVNVARVRMSLEEFEIENDNNDPNMINFAGFRNDRYVEANFKLMQEMQSRGIEIIATFWDVPDWMVENPQSETDRIVKFDHYDELAESITTWLVMARDEYGIEVSYVSVNEPEIGVELLFAEWELTTLILESEPHFKQNNLSTRWLLADTSDTASSALFATTMLINGDIADLTGPFAFHSWDADVPDEGYFTARDFAWSIGRPVWCTEAGHRWWAYKDPSFFPTWENAIGLAQTYSRVLKMSGAEVMLYWEMMGHDFWLNDGENPFYSFETVRLFNDYFPEGTTIVDSSSNTEQQFIVAGQTSDFFSVHLVNTANKTQTIILEGIPEGDYEILSFTETSWVQSQGIVPTSDGILQITVEPSSVYVLVSQ